MNTTALKLPKGYTNIEKEEIEYLDGGWYVQKTWWGGNVYLTHKERQKLTTGQTIAGLIAAVVSVGLGAAAIGAAATIVWNYDDGYGVRIRFTGVGKMYAPTGFYSLTKSQEKNIASRNRISF